MSTLDLSPDEFRTLESLRQKLANLTSNLKSLQDNVLRSNPLPTPSSLQASARIAQHNLESLQSLLSEKQDLFSRLAVHPSTNFPGREHENILQTFLRKRLEPDVESWVEKAKEEATRAGVRVGGTGAENGKGEGRGKNAAGKRRGDEDEDEEDEDDDDEDEEGYRPEDDEDGEDRDPLADLWVDVKEALFARIRGFVEEESLDVYTAEEREMGVENVRTGLKRDLEEEEDDEEDSEDDEGGDGDGGKGKEEDEDVVMLGPGGVPAQKVQQKPEAQGQVEEKRETRVAVPEFGLWFAARGGLGMPQFVQQNASRAASGPGAKGMPPRR